MFSLGEAQSVVAAALKAMEYPATVAESEYLEDAEYFLIPVTWQSDLPAPPGFPLFFVKKKDGYLETEPYHPESPLSQRARNMHPVEL